MTTAQDVIADEIAGYLSRADCALGEHKECASKVIAALLSAPESVRLELAALLNPWRPIETAPKDRPILAWMWGRWRVAKWDAEPHHTRPRPYWAAAGLGKMDCHHHQPKWWAELPAPPSEDVT